MLIRHFISLSVIAILLQQSVSAAENIPSRVESLGNAAVVLERSGQHDAAVERMKDAVCLADLLKVSIADQVDFLLRSGIMDDTARSANPILLSRQTTLLRNYCDSEILRKTSIKSFEDIARAEKVWGRGAEIPPGVARRLRDEVAVLAAETREQKRAKVKAIVLFSSDNNYYESRDWKRLDEALDIAEQMQPPDPALQKIVLEKMLSPLYGVRNPEDLKFIRRAVEAALAITDTNNSVAVDSALNVLIEHEDLATLVSLCEKQEARTRTSEIKDPQVTQYVVPDILYTGWTYLVTGRIDEAKKRFEEVVSLTKGRPDCETLYECAEVSLAKAELSAGQTADCERRLLDIVKFLDSPSRADTAQYGAIANALLGRIQEDKNNFESARKFYEKADEGLMSAQFATYEYVGFRGIKKLLATDEFVLERLKIVYKQLGLFGKVASAERNLASLRKASDESERAHRLERTARIDSSIYLPRNDVIALIQPYQQALESSSETLQKQCDSLNRAAESCLMRGLPSQAKAFLDRADALNQEPKFRRILNRNRACALGLLGSYDESNFLLRKLTADGITSDDEKFVARWLLTRNLAAQDKTAEAAQMLNGIMRLWTADSGRSRFFRAAVCDQAKMFIAQKKFQSAESCLKGYLSKPNRTNVDYVIGDSTASNYPFALLAYVLVLNGKKDEAGYLYTQASAPDRNKPLYGVQAAETAWALGDAALAFDDKDRARRYYFEAFQAFSDMDGFESQSKACKLSCDALM